MASITQTVDGTRVRNRGAGVRRNRLQAESIIRVNSDFGQIVRESNIQNGAFSNFDPQTTDITLLNAHNALTNYIRDILPKKVPGSLNTETGCYRLCPTLRQMFRRDVFDPRDIQLKWRLIIANSSQLPGAAPRPTATPTPTVRSGTTAEPLQYEPAPINIDRQRNNENVRRKRLRDVFTKFDKTIKSESGEETKREEKAGHWTYPEPNSQHESTSESDPKKPRLDEDQTCVICMENRRTHAFLHVGLSTNDVTAHFVACQTCANSCYWAEKGCPCCRTPVVNVIRIVN